MTCIFSKINRKAPVVLFLWSYSQWTVHGKHQGNNRGRKLQVTVNGLQVECVSPRAFVDLSEMLMDGNLHSSVNKRFFPN